MTPTVREELAEVFRSNEKPAAAYRIGAESEKFGVQQHTLQPLAYEGEFGVCRIFHWLVEQHGWTPFRERDGGPILGLKRGGASITLEPGAQFELSGAALETIHEIADEQVNHFEEMDAVAREMGLEWLLVGFHPFARLDELPWVPKERYPIMREYLPARGHRAHDMMQRTSTVQANFDWSSEEDAMRKVQVALKLSPLVHALFANAPFREGGPALGSSERGEVWLHMDPSRSGLIRRIWDAPSPKYEDYVEWSLDAGMFLFRRGDRFVKNTGQTFRDFLHDGFEGERATLDDYKLHLTTLFPEVRLKNTIEVRSADSVPVPLLVALVAVWTGVLYDERALAEADELTAAWRFDDVENARRVWIRTGLHGDFLGRPGFDVAARLLAIARGGLERRARVNAAGQNEAVHLEPIERLVAERQSPADALVARLGGEDLLSVAKRDLRALFLR